MLPKLPLLALILLAHALSAPAEDEPFESRAESYLNELTSRDAFAGAVLVATNGSVVFARGFGFANREHDIPNTIATKFRIGSVSKQFTAMCILLLQEDGKLSVNDPISTYLDASPPAWSSITIAHLLNHTSGIPCLTEFEDNLQHERNPTTVRATVQRFIDKPLEFSPGTRFAYSNSGYVLLGYIIERVTGDTYERFLSDRILQPIGLTETGYDHPWTILKNRASGYSRERNRIVNCAYFAMDTPHAAGALYSTVTDLLKWDRAVHSGRILRNSALGLMFTPYQGSYTEGWWSRNGQYCFGWFRKKSGSRVLYEHPGSISGFQADVISIPQEQIYIAVLSNLEWADSEGIASHLLAMLLK